MTNPRHVGGGFVNPPRAARGSREQQGAARSNRARSARIDKSEACGRGICQSPASSKG
ncbi:hypothetical protein QUF80_01680 [Desulfococcaceae bacterium HSG8]|nr:hypothetical protein [Desulfococcaceae bacterium HSG8]